MKFRVKQWERRWADNSYKDIFNDIGIFDVQISGDSNEQMAFLKNEDGLITVTGVFSVVLEKEFLSFNGFVRTDELKHVRYRCYSE